MSKKLDLELSEVISKVGLVHREATSCWNKEVVATNLNKIKRTIINHAEYEDFELFISGRGEEELKELQGLIEEKLEEVRRENP